MPYISPHVNLTSRTSQIGSRIINICFSHRNANLVQILFFWNEPQPALKTKKGRANFLYSSIKDGNFSVFAKIAAAAISQKLSLSAVVRTSGDNRNREEHNYVSETNSELKCGSTYCKKRKPNIFQQKKSHTIYVPLFSANL